ncbi:hypothetical protein NGRA_3194 [Nosema granulosis]|uniref:Uncharacterized protein n=1 Tax=Nosema granulosis TaxID=83296 RepID=A0A9P6GV67_9MICR|nr:hypothetical protein NGRA_3194 [Nosema granulosis]
MTDFGRKRWSLILAEATLAYNLSFNRAIKRSPYIFNFGVQKELEMDKKFGRTAKTYTKQELIQERNENFVSFKRSIDKWKRSIKRDLKVWEKVLLFRRLGTDDKMTEKWWVGYIITDLTGDDAYMVKKKRKCTTEG